MEFPTVPWGIIADELNAVGQQQRLHSIGQQVHEVFLAARPGDIGVIFLGVDGLKKIVGIGRILPDCNFSFYLYGNLRANVLQ
ncbi:MAG: hypothetical protein ACLUNQ_00250 [Oscillospiraceae bacterium]